MTPQKAAWYVTTAAIAKGRLVRPNACACGTTVRVEAHHDDYARPLDVLWLCRKCHRARHREKGQLRNGYGPPAHMTRDRLVAALLKSGGSVTQAAAALGVHRVTIHKWMRGYGISVERRPVVT